jgi:hypothetical protein
MHRKATEAVKHLAPLPDQAHLQAMLRSVPRQLAMPSARDLEMIKLAFESPAVKAMQTYSRRKTEVLGGRRAELPHRSCGDSTREPISVPVEL